MTAPAPELPKNFLAPCILLLLGERPAHGYDLLSRLAGIGLGEPRGKARYADSGAVYRTLHRLEGDGLVCSDRARSTGAGRRRMFALTTAGRDELHRCAQGLSETSRQLEAFDNRYG